MRQVKVKEAEWHGHSIINFLSDSAKRLCHGTCHGTCHGDVSWEENNDTGCHGAGKRIMMGSGVLRDEILIHNLSQKTVPLSQRTSPG